MSERLFSVRVKMTLAYSVSLTALLATFAIGTFLFTRGKMLGQLSSALRGDLSTIEDVVIDDPDELSEIAEHDVVSMFRVERGGQVLYETSGWPQLQIGRDSLNGNGERTTRGADGRYYRIASESSGDPEGGKITTVMVAQDAEPVRHALASLAWVIGLAFPIVLMLGVIVSYVVAGRLLAPVAVMARKAHDITAENLSDRLPIRNARDEFGTLAMAFNTLLARLEDSFDRLRCFTTDASHELRTPLTALRSVGEVALREPRDATTYRETIESMLEDTDRLTRLVESLLALARADAGRGTPVREPLDLVVLVDEVVEFLRALADERSQGLSIEAPSAVVTKGDREMIRQAVVNLINNAIKYSSPGGEIAVAVRSVNNQAIIEVSDTGPGIPLEERERIFERFYRIDKARSRESGGIGLGLAIARRSIEAQGGRIEIESAVGEGSTFRIVLPAVMT